MVKLITLRGVLLKLMQLIFVSAAELYRFISVQASNPPSVNGYVFKTVEEVMTAGVSDSFTNHVSSIRIFVNLSPL
jgi:hypothetical protein